MADASAGVCPFTASASPNAAAFDAFDRPYQADPAEALRWSREQEPVFYSPKLGYWVVSRYEDVKAVFRDNILFSPSIALEKIAPASPEAGEVLKRYNYALNRTMVNEDEPDHMERRRLLMDAFLPEKLEKHAPMIRRLTTARLDAIIDRGRADLVKDMFWDIPATVALHFLGVDDADIAELKSFSVAHTVNTWGRPSPEEQVHVAEQVGRFWEASGRIVAKMRANPDGEGWMYDSIRQNAAHPEIVTDSYLHSMMMAILVAAHETTAHASANAFRLLLSRRESWDELVENPDLIPNAVEECLRYAGSIVAWRRKTTAACTVGGVPIPEGAKLLIVMASANRDEARFENPDEVDLYRDNAADHLSFGYGSHQCMGKNIARMEMRIFIEEVARRIPGLRLVADQEFSSLPNTSFRGPTSLLVEWEPAETPERLAEAVRAPRDFPVGPPVRSEILRTLEVVEARRVGGVLHLSLRDPRGRSLPRWSAGAHLDLIHGGFRRKFSLCGQSRDSYEVAVLLEAAGRGGSRHFHEIARAGDAVRVAGPRNHFRLDENAARYVLVAGGIGITPIIAMADRLKALGKPYTLHYAGRARGAMAFLDRLAEDHGDALTLHVAGEGGRIDLAALGADLPDDAQLYACGPERMLAALEAAFAGKAEGALRSERFSSAAAALDPAKEHGFEVVLRDSDLALNVRPDQTVLDALEEAGVDLACDCREGLCGSCEATVLEGELDHRDNVLTTSERAKGDRIITCCSRARGGKIVLAL